MRRSLEPLLAQLTGNSVNRGNEFELIAEFAIWTSAGLGSEVVDVCPYADWDGSGGFRDVGIDRVVTLADGRVIAVQAKGIAAGRTVSKREMDSFLSASASAAFAERWLITSGFGVSENARHALNQQQIPVAVRARDWLDELEVDWPQTPLELRECLADFGADPARARQFRLQGRRTLYPHQTQAVADVVAAFATDERATLLMACGTGKTITCHAIMESTKALRTLVLVPSLTLVAQVLREWQRQSPNDVVSGA